MTLDVYSRSAACTFSDLAFVSEIINRIPSLLHVKLSYYHRFFMPDIIKIMRQGGSRFAHTLNSLNTAQAQIPIYLKI